MANPIFKAVYSHPELKTADLEAIQAAHEPFGFSKGEVFLKAGQTANNYFLIETGLLRSFAHDFDGNEITTGFTGANEIMIEVASLFQRKPSVENFIALTDGVAWKIEFEDFQKLYHDIPAFNEWGRAWMSHQLFVAKQRNIDMLTKSATVRYVNLLKDKPQIVLEAPLKHIATYLGVTNTSLSRIRKEIAT
ncbi:Crp/Fnr family transcriptional regulator [Subsaximicrobium wynnwilliamsii]|uniref:Crp/Fnr family transcriptional regulator n=1 Tax=Subsaximicrobium wynnwilliamsii TaxID=291179 RepID=A0A5C6ZL03_9FLAO|nr:Crp/Fnr family transcriptional regulator [Subsaximicrobium wynnwilliamsii]TXD84386.1 Crp/Fnr family transcriptional regulator [Subsaximicrobium wynnwilliamsii]TXD90067.1 Crp/Fnr family transcriptional regulator [Subsaximicrobium wynnwilliamsii]TXE04119.1 Crp/Fnr family transcriptional regulator [Subsaximicrobium wynnwilliamsii]